jgi:hypothetical protein
MNKQFSDFFKLNSYDVVKGFVVAVLTSILSAVVGTLTNGEFPTLEQFKGIAIVGLSAGVAYLLKNWLTNSQGTLGTAEKQAPVVPLNNNQTPSA